MPTLDQVRKTIPELEGLDDQSAVDVLHSVYYPDLQRDEVAASLGVKPAPAPKPDTGQFVSGFKRSFAEVPGIAAGVGAFAADAVGAGETRDKLLGYAREQNDQVAQDHATDAASITDAWDGKSSWMDFLKNSAGYVTGQALQSIATGGAGSIGMRMLVKTGAARAAEKTAAKVIAAGATEAEAKAAASKAATDALAKAGVRGAAAGAGAHNFSMELGSIYPDAADQAKAEGRDLDGGDLVRVLGAAGLAAGVDTAAEGIMAGKVLKGSGAAGGMLKRAATEVPLGMAREAGTEAVQTGIEHYGAGQPIADEKVLKDIIDSAGVGAVGGGLGGGLAATHAHQPTPGDLIRAQAVPEVGPLSRATNLGLEAGAQHADADAAAATAVAAAQPAPVAPTPEQTSVLLDMANQRAAALAEKAKGQKELKTTDASGKEVVTPEVLPQFLTPQEKTEQAFLKEHGGDAAKLAEAYGLPPGSATAAPDSPAETALAVAAPAPAAAPFTPPVDQARAAIDPMARMEKLASDAVSAETGSRMAASRAEAAAAPRTPMGEPIVTRSDLPEPSTQPRAFEQGAHPADTFEALDEANQRDDQLRKLYAPILNPKGEPFKTQLAANLAAKKHGGEVVPVDGGFVVQPAQPAPAPAPATKSEASKPEWEAFAPESGTLGAPRADMPQVKGIHRGPLVNFLEARGISAEPEVVDPKTLKPTQAEFSPQKVADAAERADDRSILISSDDHVLDGHHQWMAKLGSDEPVNAIRLDAPIETLVDEVKQFPSATSADGATKTETPDAAGPADRAVETQAPAAEEQPAPAAGGSEGGARDAEPAAARPAEVEPAGLKAEPKIVEHTTGKGKTLRGVVRTDLTNEQAKEIDAYTFKKDGGWFIREKHLAEAAAASPAAAPAPAPAPKAPSKSVADAQKKIAERLADYFTPGNVVKSYGGHDRVVSFSPETDRGGWSVKVHAVEKVDGKWVDKPGEQDRNHSSLPDPRNMLAGPVERAEPAEFAEPAAKSDTLGESLYASVVRGDMPKDNPALRKQVEAFDGKEATPARMKEAQEALETAIVRRAREVVADGKSDRATFDALLSLYESQPNLNVRTSTSIENQAYSTPAPLAFLAGRLADITTKTSVFEPTAGNGMLVIGAKPALTLVNELNTDRMESLKSQGFKPTQRDATEGFPKLDSAIDRVIANPPFGPIKDAAGESIKVKVDGFTLGQVDHLIAARALQTMKNDGKATLIIGANKSETGRSNNDLVFFNWLYSHYNVTSHFEVDGDLYQRQGAGWPVRVITMDGRKASDAHAPAIDTISRAKTWSEVYERFQQGLAAERPVAGRGDGAVGGGSRKADDARAVPGPADVQAQRDDRGQPEGGAQRPADVAGGSARPVVDRGAVPAERVGERTGAVGSDDQAPGPVEDGRPAGQPAAAKPARDPGARRVAAKTDDPDNQFQTAYSARSSRKDEGVLIPVNMAGPTQDALNRLEDEVGDIDEFARKELGYDTVSAMHDALMGLQVDSVASAIQQIKTGKGVIIADQTGIGKGRQAAAIIRWAAKNGKTPIFVTVKPSLFTDMFGDLHDIGTDDIAPFILNANESIKGAGDDKLFANRPALHKGVMERIVNSEKLPEGRNALFMTYSQINVENTQRKLVMALAPNAVFVLDESHNAGGESNTGEFIKGALDLAHGVTYLSATYAKRPDNMPVYFKTDIGEAVADDETLMAAMAAGGLPLQTVVANNLVKAGQMFRRERSYDGVSIESRADTAHKAAHVALSDETTQALRAIVKADSIFHEFYVKALQKELAAKGERALDDAGNQVKESVDHTQFSSVVHNFVRQMLLGLKAQESADDAIRSIERGEKPLIAVENTMGSFLTEYAENNGLKVGDSLGAFDYRTVLSRALERSRYITKQLANGDKVKEYIPLSALDPDSRRAYDAAQQVIDSLKIDIPVSPIDWMRNEFAKAGHTVAEITGRNLSVDYSDAKNPKLSQIDVKEQKDKVRTTRQFNDGTLDALILNVAGSTGISLHASERFKDQRQRHMIVAQAAQDINIFMQMLGRIHRTGQVALPKYTILSADLPAEIRPTALLSAKMKSLNANTSSNTESATSVKAADILNKYGDQIVNMYLADNPALADALNIEPSAADSKESPDDIARKATGRLALMPVKVQAQFYAEVEEQYNALLEYLNKTNQNDLEPRTFDFDARETKSATLFEGENPASPFGEDAVYNEYSVKAQGKMMTPEEVVAAARENLGDKKPSEHIVALAAPLIQAFGAFRAGLPEAQQANADNVRRNTMAFLESHPIGAKYRVDINGDTYNAVVTNIRSTHKATGNPFSLSKVQVTLAVNGALRSVTVPGTQFAGIEVSRLSTAEPIPSLFRAGPPNERETAKIVTGNLLGAYGELNGTRGSIITFTKADGTTEQGILLPKQFNFAKDTRQDYRLKTGADAYRFLQASLNKDIGKFGIMSRDNVVRVTPARDGVTIQVPKSKAKGGKYFLDAKLREVVGDFVSQGSFMKATVYDEAAAVKAIDLLMQKGALYAVPSMAAEARSILGDAPAAKLVETPAFRRSTDAATRGDGVEAFATQIASRWANAPKIVVVDNMADPRIPESVRDEDTKQRSQGAAGDPEGFYLNGTVYLVSEQLPGDRDVLRVLMHESLGHFGLRSVFGKELSTILDRMAVLQHGKVMTKAREYGLDMDKLTERRAAAEEVLAEMAQTSPELGWVQRAVAAIRTWLRDNVPGFDKMKFSDDEIVRNFIEPARGWVKDGAGPDGGGPSTTKPVDRAMFSRSLGPALAEPARSWRDVALPAGYKVNDLLNDSGKISWWDKSVGTMFNLAEKSPPFRRVYDSVQTFLNDVSYYASEAADQAPRILPRLSSIKDMGRAALSAEDTKAIAAPIFEGTLSWARDADGKPVKHTDLLEKADGMTADDKARELLRRGAIDPNVLRMWQGRQIDEYEQMVGARYESQLLKAGIVWTAPELAARFKLNPTQISLYQEFRKSVDESLNNLSISDMLRFGGKDVTDVRDQVAGMKNASAAAEVLRDHLFAKAAEDPDRADVLNDTANKMIDKGDRAKDLIDRGYAPLSRFGQYTLDVVNPDGERAYFGLFESAPERAKMARQLATTYPDATIRQGTTSQEEYKMFAGVSPETLALFGDMLGLEEQGGDESSKVFQQYIKLAKNSRSAMKRLIERKGIAGFSEDAGRVLAGFVYSNARQTASNMHMGEIGEATQAIPQGQGQLKDAAVKLVDYVKNPQEEAQGLRGLLFAQYLGGSVASAMVNATQPLAVTFPYLSQYLGVAGSAKQMTAAVRDALKKATGDGALDQALKKAEEDGIVSPQEVHSLQAQAAGRAQLKGGDGTAFGDAAAKASNVAAKMQLLWGHVFSIPEQFNRRVTFIAAYRTAVLKGMDNPAKFAAKAVAETQFTYNKGNKPQWARGAFGATLFTFKQYTVSYLELLHRMYNAGPEGKKAALLAIAVLFLMSGTDGLPGADDLDDLIDGFMQRLGYNWNTKMEKRRFFASILGEGAAHFLAKGMTGLPGSPIDVSGRMGMGNIIPGTGLFTKKADHTSDLVEMAGPAGDLAKRAFGAVGSLADGDVKAAATGILPTAASNWAKAYDMASTGAYHDQRGYKVLDTSGYDALAKAIGFQPQDVSKVQEAGAEAARYKGLQTLRTQEITAKWANGLATGDQAQVQEAKDERDAWNAKNPDTHMKINMPSVLKRVQEIRKSKEQRIEDSTPKAVRAKVRADLREQVE